MHWWITFKNFTIRQKIQINKDLSAHSDGNIYLTASQLNHHFINYIEFFQLNNKRHLSLAIHHHVHIFYHRLLFNVCGLSVKIRFIFTKSPHKKLPDFHFNFCDVKHWIFTKHDLSVSIQNTCWILDFACNITKFQLTFKWIMKIPLAPLLCIVRCLFLGLISIFVEIRFGFSCSTNAYIVSTWRGGA